jgi:hypothetical protein
VWCSRQVAGRLLRVEVKGVDGAVMHVIVVNQRVGRCQRPDATCLQHGLQRGHSPAPGSLAADVTEGDFRVPGSPPPPPWAHQLVHPTRALWNVRALSNGCCFTHGELLIPMQASELFARARTWRMQLWEPFWIERAM